MKSFIKIFIALSMSLLLTLSSFGLIWLSLSSNYMMNQSKERALLGHQSLVYSVEKYRDQIMDETTRKQVEQEILKLSKYPFIIGSVSGAVIIGTLDLGVDQSIGVGDKLQFDEVWTKSYHGDEKSFLIVQSRLDIADQEWSVSLSYEITDVRQSIEALRDVYGMMLVFFSILSFAVSYFIATYITKPVQSFAEAFQRVSEGHYDTPIDASSLSDTNYATLANEFNTMTNILNKRLVSLEKANEEQLLFMANISHEMKTPLTSIMGYTNMLLASLQDETLLDYVIYIDQESKRMKELSHTLLKVFERDHSALVYEKTSTTDLEEYIRSIINSQDNANLNYTMAIDPAYLNVDMSLIKIMIINLLMNAFESMPQKAKNLIITGTIQESMYRLSIEDNGPGFDLDQIPELKKSFQTNKSSEDGNAGMGLYLVNKIATLHHGTFSISNRDNGGAIISITLHLWRDSND